MSKIGEGHKSCWFFVKIHLCISDLVSIFSKSACLFSSMLSLTGGWWVGEWEDWVHMICMEIGNIGFKLALVYTVKSIWVFFFACFLYDFCSTEWCMCMKSMLTLTLTQFVLHRKTFPNATGVADAVFINRKLVKDTQGCCLMKLHWSDYFLVSSALTVFCILELPGASWSQPLVSAVFLLYDLWVYPCLPQDPAGIFELVEVVGNGTYGQVYKVRHGASITSEQCAEAFNA